jgi:hypothetical protein
MHLNAVWQFRQIQTPEDGHIGPKRCVEWKWRRKIKKIVALQPGLIYINCLICHATGCLNIEQRMFIHQKCCVDGHNIDNLIFYTQQDAFCKVYNCSNFYMQSNWNFIFNLWIFNLWTIFIGWITFVNKGIPLLWLCWTMHTKIFDYQDFI